jgi:DNA-directed RNA polymerase specialized sigma24 family protein
VSDDSQGDWGLFPETGWPLVERAADEGAEGHREALGELLERYLPALRARLVQKGTVPRDEIDDLLQGFVTDKILQRDLLARADRQRGKFRTLLLTALDRYIVSRRRYEKAQKRSADRAVSLDAQEHEQFAVDQETASHAFDVAWARTVLDQALKRMQHECEATERGDVWGVFEARVLGPCIRCEKPMPYQELVTRYRLSTPRQASNVLNTGKRMFARVLRSVVCEYTPEREADAEIQELKLALSGGERADAAP